MARRFGASRIAWFGAAAAAAFAALFLREPVRNAWRVELMNQALESADRPDSLKSRFVRRANAGTTLAMTVRAWPTRRTTAGVRSDLLHSVQDDTRPEARHIAGVVLVLSSEERAGVNVLRAAAMSESHAEWWSDLAAAEIRVADLTHDLERYLSALQSVDRAIALDPRLPQAHFNRALIVERLGFERAAKADWLRFLENDPASAWSVLARSHITAVSRKATARDLWSAAQKRMPHIPPAELERLTDAHPEEARLWGESVFLTAWAQKSRARDPSADLYLEQARTIANRIAARSGERLLYNAVAAIDRARASGDLHRLERIAMAYGSYLEGRYALREHNYDLAAHHFEQARAGFHEGGSAMRGVAEQYLAMTMIRRNRIAAARTMVADQLSRERTQPGHLALMAELRYFLALCDGMQGRWGEALDAATASRDTFARLGENGKRAEAEMLIGDLLAFLGQPQVAWRHHVSAAAAFSASGDWDRLQVCAGTMNQLEIRRHRWDVARAISRIETAFDDGAPDLLAHAHLRSAVAAWQAGDAPEARTSLREAKKKAAATDPDTQPRLLADIGAVEARMLRVSDPAASLKLLTDAIAFQGRVGRDFALPALHLERGRAQLALGARDAAREDFEKGIRRLEVQRSRVGDFELRAGIFDDTRALFSEAVAESLAAGDVPKAFEYVERGRARALLDELGDGVEAPRSATITAVQQSLAPGMVLVSYCLLPDRVAIFLIDRERVTVRFGNAGADDLRRQISAFVRVVEAGGNVAVLSRSLYEALLHPIRAELESVTTLVIVPEAALERLPFGALFDWRTRTYFAEAHETLIVPSAAVFVACMRRSRSVGSPVPQSIAIFANPIAPPVESLQFLPAADAEAPSIGKRYARSLMLRRDLATAAGFQSEAPRYDVVQFSGHARIDSAEPWKSALMMDVRLTAREIARMHFPHTRLMILAACSTLVSDGDRVEGTSAIARSFLIAGVPIVIGTLWDVDDERAAAVVVRLHARLARGMPPAKALCDVQRELLRDPAYRHPAVWAAFTVLGADGSQALSY